MVLVFNDDNWVIVTSNWCLGNVPGEAVTPVVYLWGAKGEPSVAWSVTIQRPVDEVLALISSNAAEGICDLRPLQGPTA